MNEELLSRLGLMHSGCGEAVLFFYGGFPTGSIRMSPLCLVLTVTHVGDSGLRITDVLNLILLEGHPASGMCSCFLGSRKASEGRLSGCGIIGTVVPYASYISCFGVLCISRLRRNKRIR